GADTERREQRAGHRPRPPAVAMISRAVALIRSLSHLFSSGGPNMATPSPAWPRWLRGGVALLALIVTGFLLARSGSEHPADSNVTAEVLEANNRGIAYMERFDYGKAVAAFEEVRRLAPGWLPGRINLGIALLNEGGSAEEAGARSGRFGRAVRQFKAVLADPAATARDRTYSHYCLAVIYVNLGEADLARPHARKVTELDPHDAHGWYYLGRTYEQKDTQKDNRRAAEYMERAMKLDPYLGGAFYSYMHSPYAREHFPEKRQRA